MKKIIPTLSLAALLGAALPAGAVTVIGGDAASQASADAILDIVFAFDTSGSMNDDIAAIKTAVENVVANLDCPDIDVWVRARLTGIASNSSFGENVNSTVGGAGLHTEDNGPVVTTIIDNSGTYFVDDSTASQAYYKAIVTIGDEGTENGHPIDFADWAAASSANQAAISSGTLLFSWLGSPYYAQPAPPNDIGTLFERMAEGGANPYGGPSLGATGGIFVSQGSLAPAEVEARIEEVICIAATGGHCTPDGGSTALLLGAALAGLGFAKRKNR